MMKKAILLLLLCYINKVQAQNFDTHFADSTLRIAYTFTGNSHSQEIALDELAMLPRWYGKRQRLAEVPLEGNGQITVRSLKTRQVLYRNSFSTLFQEWLTYEEAKQVRRSFENVFLVPMPKEPVAVTVCLFDNRRKQSVEMTHTVNPHDILIKRAGFGHVTPYETLQQAADSTRCINIAFLAEGYTEDELPQFVSHARRATEALFAHEPFKTLQSRFNVVAVKAVSAESGTSKPSQGVWRNTALQSSFDTFYSERYLTTQSVKTLHNLLAGVPYEHIIVLVNTAEYGGGGIFNYYNLATARHAAFLPVTVHEFGHSFAGLGDEYAYEQEQLDVYPLDVEPWEPNLTTLVDFQTKWKHLLAPKTPIPTPAAKQQYRLGVFEGAGYRLKGVYCGARDCRMRSNGIDHFCEVCRDAITRLIDFYTALPQSQKP